ncbi:hypothetical protein Hanom_Chr01g00073031 [Helianthus anomalus]
MVQFVSYQVRRPSRKVKGVLSFSYEFGEKFTDKPEEPVMAYPPGSRCKFVECCLRSDVYEAIFL